MRYINIFINYTKFTKSVAMATVPSGLILAYYALSNSDKFGMDANV